MVARVEFSTVPVSPRLVPAGGTIPDTPTPLPRAHDEPTEALLRHYALRWPRRSGGRSLQRSAAAADGRFASYGVLLADGDISEDDLEQIRIDVERSTVDGLQRLFPPSLTEQALSDALGRLLRAWCCRRPNGYCQGMNFVAMVFLVVMQHGAADDERRCEESAFWTFVALMELILPSDFYDAPSMPGLQRDVRVLFELFELARTDGDHRDDWRCPESTSRDELRDILRLSAYKWFVPCFVNCLPLPTLLLYWDRLLLHRPARSAGATSAHLSLAIALLGAGLREAREALNAAEPEEGLALGFNTFTDAALRVEDGEALLALASRLDVSDAQLSFLRRRLDQPPPLAAPVAADADAASHSHRRRERRIEPSLSGVEAVALRLMGPRSSDALIVRLLKRSLLLSPPPPMPSLGHIVFYCPRLVQTCALTFAAACVWNARRVLPLTMR